MSNISVFAPFSRQIHPIGRPICARGGGGRGDGDVVKQGPPSPPAFCICSHLLCLSVSPQCQTWYTHGRQRGDKETKGDRDSPCRSPQLGPRAGRLSPLSPRSVASGGWVPPSAHFRTIALRVGRSVGWVSPHFFPGAVVLPLSIHLHLDFPSLSPSHSLPSRSLGWG